MYVILGSNSDRRVQVFGNANGKGFLGKQSAEAVTKILRERHPYLDFLVLEVSSARELVPTL